MEGNQEFLLQMGSHKRQDVHSAECDGIWCSQADFYGLQWGA